MRMDYTGETYSDCDSNPGKYFRVRPHYDCDFRKLSIRRVVTELTGMRTTENMLETCPLCGFKDCFCFIQNTEYFICFNSICRKKGHVQSFVAAYKNIPMRDAISFIISEYYEPEHPYDVLADKNHLVRDEKFPLPNPQPQVEANMKTQLIKNLNKPTDESQYDLF
jgi:hypothetical protein